LYSHVQRFTGSADRGIDIAGFVDGFDLQGVWDNYQCKHYDHALRLGDYYPFGTGIAYSGPIWQEPIRFSGKEWDSESGLYYFGYRFYNSKLGRWMNPDPSGVAYANLADPQSFNLYNYVENNPVNAIDLNGLCPQDYGCENPNDELSGPGGIDAGFLERTFVCTPCEEVWNSLKALGGYLGRDAGNDNPDGDREDLLRDSGLLPNYDGEEEHQFDLVVERTNKLLNNQFDARDHLNPQCALEGG
jgi:RHS repeat-associated protein